ncbi:MAG: hypothetical protein Q7U66_11430 [Methylobacter sp.]|nr:hypothetical protein [Methylobacter sp.]
MTETKKHNLEFLKKWMKAKFVESWKLKYSFIAERQAHESNNTTWGFSVPVIMIILN